jgi:threonine dehydrogenase-like Zn-dependent dehydrogenase
VSFIDHVPGLAVYPGTPHSLHLTEVPLPPVRPSDVLVNVVRAGVCGTDREIIEAKFGSAPAGSNELVIGHEVLGVVESVGSDVSSLVPGDFVTATARRGCNCGACAAGESDFCSTLAYQERGIIGLHGYFTERFVEHFGNLVTVPPAIAATGVLVEPVSVSEKAWRVVSGVQSRIRSWRPKTAVVYGAGPIGVLTTLVLRSRGLDVFTLDLKPAPNANEAIVAKAGANYVCTLEGPACVLKRELPNVDLIIECTGSTAPLAEAMHLLGNNGVLVLLSATGGSAERTIPADRLNLEWVLGNKVMVGSVNSSLADFRAAVADLQRFDQLWPGLTEILITHRLNGLEEALDLSESIHGAVKAVIEIGSWPRAASHEPRATSREPRAASHEPRAARRTYFVGATRRGRPAPTHHFPYSETIHGKAPVPRLGGYPLGAGRA